jgi:nucleoside-diphosphate-sugar epimerase
LRVCITGGCGFIGTNLTEYLGRTEPNTEIVLVDLVPPCIELPPNAKYVYADIRNLKSLMNAFEDCDEVYNLAGILGTSELISISSLACEVNVVGACNVFDAAITAGVKRVYNVAKPHFEGYAENAYTLTKHAGELLGIMYREKFGLDVATVRWLNAVGPHQHLYPVRKFVPMMILLALHGLDLEVYGTGRQTIDPIDVEDMSRFTVYACRNLGKHEHVVDLGSGEAVTVLDAAKMILDKVREYQKHCGWELSASRISHVPMRVGEGDDINLKADMTYWQSQGMRTEVSFEESVAKTIRYVAALPDYVHQNALNFYHKKMLVAAA